MRAGQGSATVLIREIPTDRLVHELTQQVACDVTHPNSARDEPFGESHAEATDGLLQVAGEPPVPPTPDSTSRSPSFAATAISSARVDSGSLRNAASTRAARPLERDRCG